MKTRTKVIIGVVIGIIAIGSCSDSWDKEKTPASIITTTTSKPVPTTSKPVPTTSKPVTITPKQCYVNGYTRKDGTQVAGYYRNC